MAAHRTSRADWEPCTHRARVGFSFSGKSIWQRDTVSERLNRAVTAAHGPCISNAKRIKSAVRGMPNFPLITVHELTIAL